ncbi:WD40 repeat-like protein [Gigaspora margarita]|uniref:WD40 repeat-like protein n=1 Tax=Gigaspora margarita TaxID=4874 RepID=A0A8H4AEC0_GIGMA|nr:WD40 repeat-like protein [Gigaspora margarita]
MIGLVDKKCLDLASSDLDRRYDFFACIGYLIKLNNTDIFNPQSIQQNHGLSSLQPRTRIKQLQNPQSTQNFEITKHNMNTNGNNWISFTAIDIIASPNNGGKYLLVATNDENGRIIIYKPFNTINCGIDDQQNKINKNEGISSLKLIQLANFYNIPLPESSPISLSLTILLITIRKFINLRLL